MSRIGIKELSYYFYGSEVAGLKRDILMFDKIVIVDESLKRARALSELFNKSLNYDNPIQNFNDQSIEALEKGGYLEVMPLRSFEKQYGDTPTCKKYWEGLEKIGEEKLLKLSDTPYLFSVLNRMIANVISKETENFSVPILDNNIFNQMWKIDSIKSNTLNFLLSEIPEPDDSISFEQLFDFKRDPDTQKKFYRLMTWANEVSTGQLTKNEIEDKYKELLFEYSESYRIHKMKYKLSIMEIISTVGTQLASLKFDEINKTILSIKRSELSLMEAEASFPGKQLAYIHKTNGHFPHRKPDFAY